MHIGMLYLRRSSQQYLVVVVLVEKWRPKVFKCRNAFPSSPCPVESRSGLLVRDRDRDIHGNDGEGKDLSVPSGFQAIAGADRRNRLACMLALHGNRK